MNFISMNIINIMLSIMQEHKLSLSCCQLCCPKVFDLDLLPLPHLNVFHCLCSLFICWWFWWFANTIVIRGISSSITTTIHKAMSLNPNLAVNFIQFVIFFTHCSILLSVFFSTLHGYILENNFRQPWRCTHSMVLNFSTWLRRLSWQLRTASLKGIVKILYIHLVVAVQS